MMTKNVNLFWEQIMSKLFLEVRLMYNFYFVKAANKIMYKA